MVMRGPIAAYATASTRVAMAAALVLACLPGGARADAPASCLRLHAGGVADTLTVPAGETARMYLYLPGQERWTEANVGHFVVRTYGKQETITPVPAAGKGYVEHTFDKPGLAMVIFAVGPASQKGKSDSWRRTTHCTKLIVRVQPEQAGGERLPTIPQDPGLTAKVGDFIEVLPLIAPTSLRVGSDLPVRIYFNGDKQKDARVSAHRPDGSTQTRKTDSVGTTHFDVTQPGRWIIRYTTTFESTTYVGDLVFDVPGKIVGKGGER